MLLNNNKKVNFLYILDSREVNCCPSNTIVKHKYQLNFRASWLSCPSTRYHSGRAQTSPVALCCTYQPMQLLANLRCPN